MGNRHSYDFKHDYLLDMEDPVYIHLTMSRTGRHMVRIAVTDVEKRYKPTRHYVYILQVKWSDNSEYVIYRAYSDFYEFHITLLEMFPKEAGSIVGSERSLPYLPSRKWFSRSEVQRVASKRQVTLDSYCKGLLDLPGTINQCPHVLGFFKADQSDLSPPEDSRQKPRPSIVQALMPFLGKDDKSAIRDGDDLSISGPMVLEQYTVIGDFEGSSRREVSLKLGQVVDVLEKHENGWWFVQSEDGQGWAPASFLDPLSQVEELDEPDPDFKGTKFITTNEYEAQFDDEVSFPKDAILLVIHQLLDGWWIVRYKDSIGYAPSAYMTPYSNPHLRKLTVLQRNRVSSKLIPRRRTINKSAKRNSTRPQRDLDLYRKRSDKEMLDKGITDKAIYMNTRYDSGIYENEDFDRSRGNTINSDDSFTPRDRNDTHVSCQTVESIETLDCVSMEDDSESYEYIEDFVESGPVMPENGNPKNASDDESQEEYECPADYYDFNTEEYDDTIDDDDMDDYDDVCPVNPGITPYAVCQPGHRFQPLIKNDSSSSSYSSSKFPSHMARGGRSPPHPPTEISPHGNRGGAQQGGKPRPVLHVNTSGSTSNNLRGPGAPTRSHSEPQSISPDSQRAANSSPDSGIALSQSAFNLEMKNRLAKMNLNNSPVNRPLPSPPKDSSSSSWLHTGAPKQRLPPTLPKPNSNLSPRLNKTSAFHHNTDVIAKPRSQSNVSTGNLAAPGVQQRPIGNSDSPLSIHEKIAMFQAST